MDSHGLTSGETRPDRKQARRRDLNWDEHKEKLRVMYLDNNQRLEDIMSTMRDQHHFVASAEQYKKCFSRWEWQKNLPFDKALWMLEKAHKRKREDNKETEFAFGGLRWREERIANTVKRSRKQEPAPDLPIRTPREISYNTPEDVVPASPRIEPRPRRKAGSDSQPISVASSPASAVVRDDNDNYSEAPVLAWQGFTKPELDSMLGGADHLVRTGDLNAAEQMLRQVWTGYKAVLGSTHEETCKVAYRLASFHAEQDNMMSAHEVLDEMSRLYIEKLGIHDRRSRQHVLHVVELLNGWNRPSEALAFLARANDYVDPKAATRSTRRRKSTQQKPLTVAHPTRPLSISDAAQNMVNDPSPEQIDNGLGLASSYVSKSDETIQPLLLAILQRCEYNTNELAKQRLKAWTQLLKLYVKLNTVDRDNIVRLRDAILAFNAVLTAYPWDSNKFTSLEVMEALLELAATLLRCALEVELLFRNVIDKAEILYGIEDERTIWMLISVGLVYQSAESWEFARPWFHQALNSAMLAFGEKDGITQSLQAAVENEHFSYLNDEGRPFRSVFGVTGIVVRPGRLHIE